MVSDIFCLILLLSPICVGANVNMDMFDIIFFRTGIIVLFAASLLDEPKRVLPIYLKNLLAFLLAICIINLFIHTFAPMVLHTSLNVFLAVLGLCTVYIYWDDKKSVKKFILGAALINLGYFILQKFGFNPAFDIMPFKGQEGAFLGNQPRLMTYFAIVTPFLPLYMLPISIVLGIYTKQIVIFIPVILAILMRLKKKGHKIVFCLLTLPIFFILHKQIIQSLSFRFNISWYPILKRFFDRPLIGFGLGISPIPELEVIGNSYLQFIVGVGIIGAVWFLAAFRMVIERVNFNIAFISLAIIMLIEYPIELPRLWFMIMAIISMALLESHKKAIV